MGRSRSSRGSLLLGHPVVLLDSSAEDVWVTETISTGPDGTESLEVVFTPKPVCKLPASCGVIELIRCKSGVTDEEETPTIRVAEEAVQETNFCPAATLFRWIHIKSKERQDDFATALKNLLSAASVASVDANFTPSTPSRSLP